MLSHSKYSVPVHLMFIWILTDLELNQELLNHLQIIYQIDELFNITYDWNLNSFLKFWSHGDLLRIDLIIKQNSLHLWSSWRKILVQVLNQLGLDVFDHFYQTVIVQSALVQESLVDFLISKRGLESLLQVLGGVLWVAQEALV